MECDMGMGSASTEVHFYCFYTPALNFVIILIGNQVGWGVRFYLRFLYCYILLFFIYVFIAIAHTCPTLCPIYNIFLGHKKEMSLNDKKWKLIKLTFILKIKIAADFVNFYWCMWPLWIFLLFYPLVTVLSVYPMGYYSQNPKMTWLDAVSGVKAVLKARFGYN